MFDRVVHAQCGKEPDGLAPLFLTEVCQGLELGLLFLDDRVTDRISLYSRPPPAPKVPGKPPAAGAAASAGDEGPPRSKRRWAARESTRNRSPPAH